MMAGDWTLTLVTGIYAYRDYVAETIITYRRDKQGQPYVWHRPMPLGPALSKISMESLINDGHLILLTEAPDLTEWANAPVHVAKFGQQPP